MGQGIWQTHVESNGIDSEGSINLSPTLVDQKEPGDILVGSKVSPVVIEVDEVTSSVVPSRWRHEAGLWPLESDSLQDEIKFIRAHPTRVVVEVLNAVMQMAVRAINMDGRCLRLLESSMHIIKRDGE